MIIQRVWAMPNSCTFSVKPIREFVERYVADAKVIVDPFARNTSYGTITNDLNSNTNAQYHLYAIDFLKMLVECKVQADLVLYDPPYSPRQVKECYDGIGLKMAQDTAMTAMKRGEEKTEIAKILKPTGKFLHFGWHTNGLGKKHGFEIEEIILVAHGADHNDTICMAERRSQ